MKAVVMETRGRKAAVLLKDGTFRIAHGQYQVGETIDYRDETPSLRRWLAAAAAVVVGVGIGGGFWYDANYAAYGEVSIDAQPSIVYTVNKKDQVLSVRAANADAEGVVDALTEDGVRFLPIASAVEKTMAILEAEGYLEADRKDYVLIGVSADGERQERLSFEVETGMQRGADDTVEYRIDRTDRATANRAAENNMSAGRYAEWEAAGNDSEPDAYAVKPVKEIMSPTESEKPSAAGEPPAETEAPEGGIPEKEDALQDLPLNNVDGNDRRDAADGAERPNEGERPVGEEQTPAERGSEGPQAPTGTGQSSGEGQQQPPHDRSDSRPGSGPQPDGRPDGRSETRK